MRVFALSDIHADYEENQDWVLSLSTRDYLDDVLILAGDISDDMATLSRVFASLSKKFEKVFFVPGNHELWVQKDGIDCSLEKFTAVNELCARHDIHTTATHLGAISFVPLLGWYDYSFAEPGRELRLGWRDYKACSWPASLDNCAAINDYFLSLNEEVLNIKNETVISFSHFLPRIDVMPGRIPQSRRTVYPVLGSDKLGAQVRQLKPDIHVYGHSHVNQSIMLDGIRFVNNAFAYPSEQRIARKQLHCIFEAREDDSDAA